MSVSDRAVAFAPYVERLLDDPKVQSAVREAAVASREAYQRGRGKSPAKALKDRKLRRRVADAVSATWEVWTAIDAPGTSRRPHWGRRLALLTAAAAGAYVAL